MQTFQMIQILKRKAKVLLLWQMQIGQKEYYILNFCDKINFSFLHYLKIIIFLTGPIGLIAIIEVVLHVINTFCLLNTLN